MKSKSPVEAFEKLAKSRRPNKTPAPLTIEAKAQQLNLPLWPDAVRAVPNAVLRGSLFTVSKQRADFKKSKQLTAVEGIEIRFKGERLNQTDLDLWEMLLHMARLQPLGNRVEFISSALLKELGRGTGGKDHEELKEDIMRLIGAVVDMKWTGTKKGFNSGLVVKSFRDEITQRYVVILSPEIVSMYDNGYTNVDWEKRKALKGSNLAKWLQGYYASHAEPYPIKVETIKSLCGSEVSRLGDFRKMLRKALDDLVAVGSILSWTINKDDLVKVKNVISMSQAKHLIVKQARLGR